MPFALKGWDADNPDTSGEFLNHALLSKPRGRPEPVEVTRSRPCRKNDQAHVERKNATHACGATCSVRRCARSSAAGRETNSSAATRKRPGPRRDGSWRPGAW